MTRVGPALSRRKLFGIGGGIGAAGLAIYFETLPSSRVAVPAATGSASAPVFVKPTDPIVAAVERARPNSGRAPVAYRLVAAPAIVDLAGRTVSTWAYASPVGTRELRASVGDTLSVKLANQLPEPTTVHWHGIRIRNDMDGVAPVTQQAVESGKEFTYTFRVAEPGTYWYHPHVGLQADRGLYGPLIVEDPDDREGVDVDQVIVIDDWLDGLGATPDEVLRALNPALGDSMAGMDMSGSTGGSATASANPAVNPAAKAMVSASMTSAALKGPSGEIRYPMHLINGRPPADRQTIAVRTGGKVRLRIINAAADTPYRFAVAGHQMTVTHADGYPVTPFATDTLIIGMAERYDVLVTPRSGAWPIVAKAEGKPGLAAALLRTGDASATSAPDPGTVPAELNGRMLRYADLKPLASARLSTKPLDHDYFVSLVGDMKRFVWGIAGADAAALIVKRGERARIAITNKTTMWHPMHLHGHTFAVVGANGLRKDTVIVLPGQTVAVDFDADNPGAWMLHCHNAYHFEAGMTANVNYAA